MKEALDTVLTIYRGVSVSQFWRVKAWYLHWLSSGEGSVEDGNGRSTGWG
jgi:hypothetical protein